MNLFINCCPREDSRTKRLAMAVLKKLGAYDELNLYEENILPLNRERLDYRTELIEKGDYSDKIFDYAKQFAVADYIVIAAPFWDLSFPSELKIYLENIYVSGIVTRFTDEGRVQGLCKAKKLFYVTTAGGPYKKDYSFDYITDMVVNYFGVEKTVLIKAEMLDIVGNSPEEILEEAIASLD